MVWEKLNQLKKGPRKIRTATSSGTADCCWICFHRSPHQHRQRDRLYLVKIKLNVPGGEINVSKQHWHDESHRDVYVAIRDAFRAVRRRLQDHQRLIRGDIKANYKPDRAKVSKIFYEQGYGFLEDDLGNEIYFDANSVLGDFERITPGQTVKYKKEQGEQGSQASTVAV